MSLRVHRLPYVEATILELLRHKTVAPVGFPHRTLKDTEVGGYFIPGGTTVSWRVYEWSLRELHRVDWQCRMWKWRIIKIPRGANARHDTRHYRRIYRNYGFKI